MDIFAELEQTRQIIVMIDTQLSGTVGALRRVHTGVFHDDQTGTSFRTLFVIQYEENSFHRSVPRSWCPSAS